MNSEIVIFVPHDCKSKVCHNVNCAVDTQPADCWLRSIRPADDPFDDIMERTLAG